MTAEWARGGRRSSKFGFGVVDLEGLDRWRGEGYECVEIEWWCSDEEE